MIIFGGVAPLVMIGLAGAAALLLAAARGTAAFAIPMAGLVMSSALISTATVRALVAAGFPMVIVIPILVVTSTIVVAAFSVMMATPITIPFVFSFSVFALVAACAAIGRDN